MSNVEEFKKIVQEMDYDEELRKAQAHHEGSRLPSSAVNIEDPELHVLIRDYIILKAKAMQAKEELNKANLKIRHYASKNNCVYEQIMGLTDVIDPEYWTKYD